jgi:feruloyl esterase
MRLAIVAGIVHLALSAPAQAATCEGLSTLRFPNTTILTAATQAAGTFAPPAPAGARAAALNPAFAALPAFCRIEASLRPSSDSDIRVEVWLPASGWNGKLQSVGNGAWAGTIGYAALAQRCQVDMRRRRPTPATWATPHSSSRVIRRR